MKRPRIISADEAAKLWATYQRVGSVMAAARLHRRNMNTLRKLFDRKGWLAIRPTPVWTNKQARAIYADYCRPMPQRQVGRKWGISGKSVRQLFMRRGLKLRPNKWEPKSGRRADGTIAKARPHTRKQLDAIIAGMDRLKIPQALNHEWRTWTLERRMEFIRSVRARLRNPKDRPETPFSKNVIPFDYGTPAAWEIVRKMNAGLNSRFWKIKLNLTSMGVIWRGQLFFCHPPTILQFPKLR